VGANRRAGDHNALGHVQRAQHLGNLSGGREGGRVDRALERVDAEAEVGPREANAALATFSAVATSVTSSWMAARFASAEFRDCCQGLLKSRL
jgi:hypothetical protein